MRILSVLYILSFGPACWLFWAGVLPQGSEEPLREVYGPLMKYALHETGPVAEGLVWWSAPGCDDAALRLWMIAPHRNRWRLER
jgi:hypothetical protein